MTVMANMGRRVRMYVYDVNDDWTCDIIFTWM